MIETQLRYPLDNPSLNKTNMYTIVCKDCAKFSGSRIIVSLVGLVPSCLCGYFVGPRFFVVDISWVRYFFSWVSRGSKIFFRGYFEGPTFFLVDFSWDQNFLLVANFLIQRFLVVGCMRKSDRK